MGKLETKEAHEQNHQSGEAGKKGQLPPDKFVDRGNVPLGVQNSQHLVKHEKTKNGSQWSVW